MWPHQKEEQRGVVSPCPALYRGEGDCWGHRHSVTSWVSCVALRAKRPMGWWLEAAGGWNRAGGQRDKAAMAVSTAILGKQTTFPQEEDPERNSILVWAASPLEFLINSQNSSARKLLRHFGRVSLVWKILGACPTDPGILGLATSWELGQRR